MAELLFADLASGQLLGELPYSSLSFSENDGGGSIAATVDLEEVLRPRLGADYVDLVFELGGSHHWPLDDADVSPGDVPRALLGETGESFYVGTNETVSTTPHLPRGVRTQVNELKLTGEAHTPNFNGSVTIPATASVGDMAIAVVLAHKFNASWTDSPGAPAGWTLAHSDSAGFPHMAYWWKELEAGEPGSVATFTNPAIHSANMTTWSGHNGAAPRFSDVAGSGGLSGDSVTTAGLEELERAGVIISTLGVEQNRGYGMPQGLQRLDTNDGYLWPTDGNRYRVLHQGWKRIGEPILEPILWSGVSRPV